MNIVYKLRGDWQVSGEEFHGGVDDPFAALRNWFEDGFTAHWSLVDWCRQGPDLVAAICTCRKSVSRSLKSVALDAGLQSRKPAGVVLFHVETPHEVVCLSSPSGLCANTLAWRPPLDLRLFRRWSSSNGGFMVSDLADSEQTQANLRGTRTNWPRLLTLYGHSLWQLWEPEGPVFRANRWRAVHEEECEWQLREIAWLPQLDIPIVGVCGLSANGELQLWLCCDTEDSGEWSSVHRTPLTDERVLVGRIQFIDPGVSSMARSDSEPVESFAQVLESCFSPETENDKQERVQTREGRLMSARVVYVTDANVDECHVCDIGIVIPSPVPTDTESNRPTELQSSSVRVIVHHIGCVRSSGTGMGGIAVSSSFNPHVHRMDPARCAADLIQQIQICDSTGDLFVVNGGSELQRWCVEFNACDVGGLATNESRSASAEALSSSPNTQRENAHGLDHSWRCLGTFQHANPISCIRLCANSLYILVGGRPANLTVLRGDPGAWSAGPEPLGSLRVGPQTADTIAIAPSPHTGCAFVITDDFCESGCIVQLPSNHMDPVYISKALCRLMQTREGVTQNTFDLIVRIRQEPAMFRELAKELERAEAPRRCFTLLMFCHTLLTPLWMALNAVSMPIRILESLCNAMSFANRYEGAADQRNDPPEIRMARLCSLVRPRVLEANAVDVARMFCAVNKILCMAAAWIRHASLTTMLFMRADELPSLWAALRRQDWAAITSFTQAVATHRMDATRDTAPSSEPSSALLIDSETENLSTESAFQSLGHDFLRVSFHFVHDPYYARLICIACTGAVAVLAGLQSREYASSKPKQPSQLLFDIEMCNRIAIAIHDLRDAWRGMDAELTMLLRSQRVNTFKSSSNAEHITEAVRTRLSSLKSAIHMRMKANVSLVQRLLENPRYALQELEDCAGLYGGSMRGFLLSAVPMRSPHAALAHDILTCVPLDHGVMLRRCSRTGLVSLEPEQGVGTEDSLLQPWQNTSPFGGVWFVDNGQSRNTLTSSSVLERNTSDAIPSTSKMKTQAARRSPNVEPDGMDTSSGNHRELQIPELDDFGPEIDMRHVASALRDEELSDHRRATTG
ncbi:hypothetical protein CCYA_CCYA01G0304 [Cyanidiococcus yangmingshanensis]|nr:hypothetical protein CCYA_CCYA01G0304 [Cyanidiococcus yangmingshanensis]